jgi:hypothetical protein
VVFASGIAVEETAQKCDERDPLELGAAARVFAVVVRTEQRLEPVSVAERLRGERRDHLAEAHVALRERLGLALGAEEDRTDDGRPPSNRHHDDRPHVPHVQRGTGVLQHWVVRRVGNEHRVARLERPLELRVAIQVDDEVPDRRILIARDQSDIRVAPGEVDRAAIEPERFAELARDRLQNVYEVERGRDVLQDVDDGDELVTLALQLRDPLLQPGDRRVGRGIALDR